MADRFPMVKDEHGYYRCPLPLVEWEQIEDGGHGVTEVQRLPQHRPCGAEMYVEWRFSVPVIPEIPLLHGRDAFKSAITDGWQLVCTEGHTLAVSQGEESAEPFSLHALFGPEIEEPDIFRAAWVLKVQWGQHAHQNPCPCSMEGPGRWSDDVPCAEGAALWANYYRMANHANALLRP